jgi:ribosome biogenesis protein ERB1
MPPKRTPTASRTAGGSKRHANANSKANPPPAAAAAAAPVSRKPAAVKRSREDDRDAPAHSTEENLLAGKINGGGGKGKGKASARVAEEDEEEDEDDAEEFEIDTGSSNGDLDDFLDREALESPADDEDEEDEEDDDDDDEEGYNTSDIEAMENASGDDEQDDDVDDTSSIASSSIAPSTVPDSNLTLDQLIAKHTYKPDENMDVYVSQATGGRPLVGDATTGKFSNSKEGTGRLVPSKFFKGALMREYDEIEAGYGSESSTEEVSLGGHENPII